MHSMVAPILLLSNISSLHLVSLSPERGELDKSSELLIFHEAISNLVESEEQLVKEHKAIIHTGERDGEGCA